MSKGKLDIRDVSPFLQMWRNFLLGRKHTLALRFEKDVASRSPPLPNLPEGPAHRLNKNYYYARDARREVTPPEVIVSGQSQIGAGSGVQNVGKLCTPGKPIRWD